MTTDNVLCTGSADSEELQPLSIKYASALRSAGSEDKEYVRTIEKLQIEERYWIRRGPWFLCTDALLPLNRVLNLDALRTAVVAEESDWLNPRLPEFVVTFREFWSDRKHLKDIFFETAIELRVTPADIAVLFGRAVWLRLLPIDLDSSVIHHEFPVARLFLISCPRTLSRTVDFFHSNR
jgi:hypothetical protein